MHKGSYGPSLQFLRCHRDQVSYRDYDYLVQSITIAVESRLSLDSIQHLPLLDKVIQPPIMILVLMIAGPHHATADRLHHWSYANQ